MNRASIDKAVLAQLGRSRELLLAVDSFPCGPWTYFRDKGHHHATRDRLHRQGLLDIYCGTLRLTLAGRIQKPRRKNNSSVIETEESDNG